MQICHYAVLASIAVICYLPALTGDFVFDDKEAVVTNDDVDPSLSHWYDVFAHDFWGTSINSSTSHKSYRPLTILSFRLDFLFGGGRRTPFVFHLTNLILHPLVVVLFVSVTDSLQHGFGVHVRDRQLLALIAGVLFAVHPIHTECVAGIVGRAELWSAVFYFLALQLHQTITSTPQTRFLLSAVYSLLIVSLAGIGMLFKEQGITVLGVCMLFEVIRDHKMLFAANKLIRLMVILIGTVLLLLLRMKVMKSLPPKFQPLDNPAAFNNSSFTRIMTLNYIYSLDAWLLLNPQWLCFDWSMGCIPLITSLLDLRIAAVIAFWCAVLCIGASIMIRTQRNERKFLLMCFVLTSVPFLPSSNIFFNVGFVIAERVLYLPSAGYCLLVALGFRKLYKLNEKLTLCLLSVVVFVSGGRSFERTSDWQTEEKLFTSGLTVCRQNAKVHYNVGKVKADKGLNDEAEQFYREAIRLHPSYDHALNNLGNLLKDTGRPEEAETMFERALNISPKFAAAWMNLGIVQSSLKKHKEAEESYLLAIKRRKKYPGAYYNLGLLYIDTQQYENAVSSFKAAIHYERHHIQAWKNLGILYQNIDQLNLAEEVYRQAIAVFPHLSQFYSSLGVVLGKQAQYKQGEKELLTAIKMDPKNANYYGNLGVIYHLAKEYESAKRSYEKALQLNPSLSDTRQNLLKLENKIS